MVNDDESAVLEIVELDNGDIVLRHSDASKTKILTIQFSDELNDELREARLEVAQAMVEAGAEAYAMIIDESTTEIDQRSGFQPTIH